MRNDNISKLLLKKWLNTAKRCYTTTYCNAKNFRYKIGGILLYKINATIKLLSKTHQQPFRLLPMNKPIVQQMRFR